MKDSLRPALLSAVLLLPLAGCDKATPVAPDGTTLAISANPSTIGLNGTSTITVIGRRPNGSPLVPGTEIQFTTNLGRIDPLIATTDSSGAATAVFRADNRSGTATVTASTGTNTPTPSPTPTPTPTPATGASVVETSLPASSGVSVTTTIQVGESAGTRPVLIVSANPSNIPVNPSPIPSGVTPSTSTITIIARNSDGTSASSGQTIILTTSLGTLSNTRPSTRSDGTATSILTAGTQSGTATVSAILGASEAATTAVTIRDAATGINIQANPSSVSRGTASTTITLTANVINSQGQAVQGALVTFESDRGTLDNTNVFTSSTGVATATLTVRSENLPAGVTSFEVRAKTPNGTGQFITAFATITVTG